MKVNMQTKAKKKKEKENPQKEPRVATVMKNGPNKDKKRKKKDVKKKKRALRGQIAWKQKVKRERKAKVFAEAYVALQIQNDSNAFVHDTNQLGCIFFFY